MEPSVREANLKKMPVRIRTYLRTGNCPEGRLIEDRILRPLTRDARKAGVHDELGEWYAKYGCVRGRRLKGHAAVVEPPKSYDAEFSHDVPESLQVQLWESLHGYYSAIAAMLADDKKISYSDIDSTMMDIHVHVLCNISRFDPTRETKSGEPASFDAFCRQQARDFRANFHRVFAAKKRGGGLERLSIVSNAKDDETADRRGTISEEVLTVGRTWEEGQFARDLLEFCQKTFTREEKIATAKLIEGLSQEGVAKLLNMNLSTFRRRVLGPVQLFFDYLLPADTHKYSMAAYGSRKFILK